MKNNIKQFRKKAHLRASNLADYLGISCSAVSHYEIGRREPDLQTCRAIVAFFKSKRVKGATLDAIFPPE